jgi:hypothetical protein
MSDYKIICTVLPHGPYDPGRMRVTLLLHLQYTRPGEVRLSSLSLFHQWTKNLDELLRHPGAHHEAALQFHRPGPDGTAQQPAFTSSEVTLQPSRLRPDVWSALLADDPVVRVADTPEPEQTEQLEFQSYSQATTMENLFTASLDTAAGKYRRLMESFDLDAGDYPVFPAAGELRTAYDALSPFEAGECNSREQDLLFEAAFLASGAKRKRVERDIARLRRYKPNAALKPVAVEDIVSIHGGGRIKYTAPIRHLTPPPEEFDLKVAGPRQENVKALLFHRPIHNQDGHHAINQIQGPPPELDFHERLSVYGNHPAILRPLGLAFDLELGVRLDSGANYLVTPDLTALLSGLGTKVDLQSVYTAFKIREVGGRNYCVLANRADFTKAFADGTSHRDGMFDFVPPERYALISSEPVAAIMRVTLASERPEEPDDLPGQPPHHLRGAGLVLTMNGRDKQAANDLEGSKKAADDLVFYSEDLILGYRVDVQRFRSEDGRLPAAGDRWRSLCERTSRYSVIDRRGNELTSWTPDSSDQTINEGYIQASTFTRQADSDNNEYQVNGALFR